TPAKATATIAATMEDITFFIFFLLFLRVANLISCFLYSRYHAKGSHLSQHAVFIDIIFYSCKNTPFWTPYIDPFQPASTSFAAPRSGPGLLSTKRTASMTSPRYLSRGFFF
ncbi:MAG TPA: hypothetical protein VFF53_09005, partial [Geobacteraceae bacterium]|nr:hypothetical protein [Geobacteraceae bacterium]